MEAVSQSLVRVCELSRRMLQAARKADWESLVELERQRREPLGLLSREFGARPPSPQEAALMQEVLEADREIGTLAAERRAELAAGLESTASQRRLADAYGPY